MEPFIAQLAGLCARDVTRAKWVVVPTHALGRTLGERLAREGTNWLNLRFVTPLDLALRMGAPFLVERGIDPSEEGLGPALAMRLLAELPAEHGYFRPLATHPTMAQALWNTIRELRMAGVAPAALSAPAFASAAKHRELVALVHAYEAFLASHRRADMASVYEEALQHGAWCPIKETDCWIAAPDVAWTPLQRRLLERLPGERLLPRAADLPGVPRPRRLRSEPIDPVPPDADAHPLGFLMAPTAGVQNGGRIELFHAGSRDAEIDEVFRRICAAAQPLDEVEIACGSDAYPVLVWEKALRLDWPVTIASGIGAPHTRPGRAVLGFCRWVESDFAAAFLRRLLQSGDVRLPCEDLTAAQAARLLQRAQASWGRETYARSLKQLEHRYARMAADPDAGREEREAATLRAQRTGRLAEWIDGLLSAVPQPDAAGTVDLRAVVEAALAFLETCAARASALDAAAAAALGASVRELFALGTFRCSLPAALRFVRERVEGLAVGADRPRPGHLHVTSLSAAGYSGRTLVFAVGLEEGRVFPPAIEDPVLLDRERAAISDDLRRSSDRTEEAVYAALVRLAACAAAPRARVVFSYASRDTREFRDAFPSWLMLQAYRVQSGQPAATYPDLRAALGAARSVVPGNPLDACSEWGWWLAQIRTAGTGARDDVLRAFPWLAAGVDAERARASGAFTAFDGRVPEAGAVLDPASPDAIVSATQLEEAAACPFRHFLRRGLGLQPLDERERDPDVWLDALTRGAELHDLYARLLRRCRDDGRPASRAADREWLRDAALQRLAELRREMPPASDEVFSRECDELLADLDLFLDEECRTAPFRTPVGLEVSFGQQVAGDREELAREEPVRVPIGGGRWLRLRGRIDRIDRIGDRFEVVDYKTGRFFADDYGGVFAGGALLQHALYGLAAVELLARTHRAPVVEGGTYYFSSSRGRQERVVIPAPDAGELRAVLSDIREVIASGLFVHAPEERACTFCDFGAACGADRFERARTKLGDPTLQPYVRLRNRR